MQLRFYIITDTSPTQGQFPNSDKNDCNECEVGMFRGANDAKCEVCKGGFHTNSLTGRNGCIMCIKVRLNC